MVGASYEVRLVDWAEQNEMAREAYASAKFTTASGFARVNCPFCPTRIGKVDRKQCFSVSTTSGWWRCWRCGVSGRLDGDWEDVQERPEEQQVRPMTLPEGFYELGVEPAVSAMCFEEAREYLTTPIGQRTSTGEKGRGLAAVSTWREAHIGAVLRGKMADRVVVPILSPEGICWGWVGRTWHPGAERPYHNASGMTVGSDGNLFNHAALLRKTEKPVLVMEGVFDSLHVWPDSVALLGKATEAQFEALAASPRPVVVALDGDAWREGWALAAKLRVRGQHAGSIRLPPGKDPDEMYAAELWQAASRALDQDEATL
jgi:hypothetical protein